jgi:hypothetical protein
MSCDSITITLLTKSTGESSICNRIIQTHIDHVWGSFPKFMDSPYYSRSELCGGAVMVSFSKHLPWQAMHFLQCSIHFSKTCCRPSITSKCLASKLPFHGWKSPEITWGDIWIEFCVRLGKSGSMEPH